MVVWSAVFVVMLDLTCAFHASPAARGGVRAQGGGRYRRPGRLAGMMPFLWRIFPRRR